MRTPFTKRVNIYGYNYLTDSPGDHIQEDAQPLDFNTDENSITNEEWQATRRKSISPPRPAQADDGYDPFGDKTKPVREGSDDSGSDTEYHPPVRKPRRASLPDDLIAMTPQPSSPRAPPTAREKGKQKATDHEDQPAVVKGRLRNDTVEVFCALGASTRQEAQRLADLHRVHLATVMCHAGLGAGAGSRITSDCNSFKAIHAARTLAETGGSLLCYNYNSLMLNLFASETHCR